MRVLVAISVLAFFALVWACIGVAQHVRRARRIRGKRRSRSIQSVQAKRASARTDTFANQL